MIARRSFSSFTRILFNQNKPTSGSGPEKSTPKSASSNQKKASSETPAPKKSAEQSAPKKSAEQPAAKKSAESSTSKQKPTVSKPVDKKPEEVEYEPQRNDQYKATEYFGHNKFSFGKWMVEMSEFRLPQKSNQVKS